MFFLAGMRLKHIISAAAPLASVAAIVVFVLGYKRDRILSHIDAIIDPLQGSYHVKQSALTLGSGGWLGTGLGEGGRSCSSCRTHTPISFLALRARRWSGRIVRHPGALLLHPVSRD